MNLPKSITLNGIEYAVKCEHDLQDANLEVYGDFDEDKQLIRINLDNQTDEGKVRTMLHELCHAILHEYDVANKGYRKRVPADEETICEVFSRGFYQFLVSCGKEMFA